MKRARRGPVPWLAAVAVGCGAPHAPAPAPLPGTSAASSVPPSPRAEPETLAPGAKPAPFRPVSVGCSGHHCCAVGENGSVRCWNMNGAGEAEQERNPETVPGLPPRVKSVTVTNRYACATTTDDKVWCWWGNDFSNYGEVRPPAKPVLVLDRAGVRQVALVEQRACALLAIGEVWCWGWDRRDHFDNPALITTLPGAAQLALGSEDCARFDDGVVRCGHRLTELLGDGSIRTRDAIDIAAGGSHLCAISRGGDVSCWGHNERCQAGATVPSGWMATPFRVSGLHDAAALSLSDADSFAQRADGTVVHWGSRQCRPTPLPITTRMRQMSAVGRGICGVDRDGMAVCAVWSRDVEHTGVRAILFLDGP